MSRLLLFILTLGLFVSGCIVKEPRTPASSDQRNPWWGASDRQVETAMCRQQLPHNRQGLLNYFEELEKKFRDSNDSSTTHLFDLTLVDQPGLFIRSLYELLSPGTTFNEKVKQVTNPKVRFQIPDTCRSAACTAEAIFGQTVGLQMLYLKSRFDLNSSPYSYDDSDLFTEDELWDIISALELLPSDVLPFTLNQKLTHFSRALTNDTVLANATMGFYNRWTSKKPLHRQYIAFHEFAHKYADNFIDNLTQVDQWLTVAGWEKSEKNREQFIRRSEESAIISNYAKTNPGEDFAETVSAYRLNAHELRSTSPERYNFVRDFVFDGIEFTHSEACERKPRYRSEFENGKISIKSFSNEALRAIVRQCQPEYAAWRFGHLPKVYYSNCVQSQGLITYFQQIEKRPIPRSLVNDQYNRSDVKILGLEAFITRAMNIRISRHIWKTVGFMQPYQTTKACNSAPWTTLNLNLIEKDGIAFNRKPLALDMYKVSPQKVQLACREILTSNLAKALSEDSIHIFLNKNEKK